MAKKSVKIKTFNEKLEDLINKFEKSKYVGKKDLYILVLMAIELNKPILIEGPPGTGKTELAKVMASILKRKLIRLQCYEGIDESRVIYEWDYAKQMLYIQMYKENGTNKSKSEVLENVSEDILFSEKFLVNRPLLEAFRSKKATVFLIDELDRADREVEALLLEAFSENQITIPEIGTIKANSNPLVIITSNNMREISEALRRRCLYYKTDYPNFEQEIKIINTHIPGLDEKLATTAVNLIQKIRKFGLNKIPSIAETIDWVNALTIMNIQFIDPQVLQETLSIIIKREEDLKTVKNNMTKLSSDLN